MPSLQRVWNIASVLIIVLLLCSAAYLWLSRVDIFATTGPIHLSHIKISTTYVSGDRLYSEFKNDDFFPPLQSLKNIQSHYFIALIKSNTKFGKSILDVTIKCDPFITGHGITISVSNTQLEHGVLTILPISDRHREMPEKIQCSATKLHWK
jgi:hypothetical protein